MNVIAVHCCYQIAGSGLDNCDIALLNHRLRRTLHNRGYAIPLELVAERLRSSSSQK